MPSAKITVFRLSTITTKPIGTSLCSWLVFRGGPIDCGLIPLELAKQVSSYIMTFIFVLPIPLYISGAT
jgi:hypothetical protein